MTKNQYAIEECRLYLRKVRLLNEQGRSTQVNGDKLTGSSRPKNEIPVRGNSHSQGVAMDLQSARASVQRLTKSRTIRLLDNLNPRVRDELARLDFLLMKINNALSSR